MRQHSLQTTKVLRQAIKMLLTEMLSAQSIKFFSALLINEEESFCLFLIYLFKVIKSEEALD